MVQVFLNDVLIAEAPADKTPVVEGNYYFPRENIKSEYFEASNTQSVIFLGLLYDTEGVQSTTCFWKG